MKIPTFTITALFLMTSLAHAGEVKVVNDAQLRTAVKAAKPGTTIIIAPGKYRGGVYINNLNGTAEQRIVIRGSDAKNTPLFTGGGSEGFHLSDCNYLTLANVRVSGYPGNGVNIDDGGSFETPSRHVVVENVTIENTGPKGNHDALKMSGIDNFTIINCRFEGWGGSAIDMVGCHDGTIEGCTFLGKDGYSQDTGVQTKGGTRGILIHKSFFNNAGQRAINLGGSTGFPFFRPKLDCYEARDITVAGNRFVGSMSPIAFVTSDGGHVHHNTFYMPTKWAMRILQEQTDKRFVQCRNGVFENNLVVFDRNLRVFVNIGPNTKPGTFTFRKNAWFEVKGNRRPQLPVPEKEGVYGVDPKLEKPGTAGMKATNPELKEFGAEAYSPKKK